MENLSTLSGISRRGFIVGSMAVGSLASATQYRDITWFDLVPKAWDPWKSVSNSGSGGLRDFDPRAKAMYQQLRLVWDNAPTVAAITGQPVRLGGYLVPIEQTKEGIREFLLVPFFGACIHTPPPPANQTVHVVVKAPVRFRTMDVVSASGTLALKRSDTGMGVSGYTMQADSVVAYRGK